MAIVLLLLVVGLFALATSGMLISRLISVREAAAGGPELTPKSEPAERPAVSRRPEPEPDAGAGAVVEPDAATPDEVDAETPSEKALAEPSEHEEETCTKGPWTLAFDAGRLARVEENRRALECIAAALEDDDPETRIEITGVNNVLNSAKPARRAARSIRAALIEEHDVAPRRLRIATEQQRGFDGLEVRVRLAGGGA
ncbi:MAG: hypothetical protein R6V85_11990 [Polyangia bacterium]